MLKKHGLMLSVILLLLGIGVSQAVYARNNLKNLLPTERNTIKIFKKISPLVVNVHRLRTVQDGFSLRDVQTGMGSGFLWNKEGYIVTNYHVIRGANKVSITLQRGQIGEAKFIGAEPQKDIAVLKLTNLKLLKNIPSFDSIPIADSSKLEVGQKTIAIGNPFGLSRTVTTGIISAVGRELPNISNKHFRNMIQTDASINPGNSGGPLLDSQGQLIGMNTVIFSRSGTSTGIGFAVPSNEIKNIVDQLIQYGRVKQAGIGVQIMNDQIAVRLGVKGVIIYKVMPGSPADKAGLQGTYRDNRGNLHLGDVIIGVNNQPVKDYDDLYDALEKVNIGNTINLLYVRAGKQARVKLKTIDIYE